MALEEEMVASYEVRITGFKETRARVAQLDQAIKNLRATNYSSTRSVSGSSNFSGSDIFVTEIDALEGRIQGRVEQIMLGAMDFGKQAQGDALNAAETVYGSSGRAGGSTGRNRTGALIKAIARNVETGKEATVTVVTGWHGWREERPEYYDVQERGSLGGGGHTGKGAVARKKLGTGKGGVPAANSLGKSIIPTREKLKRDLKGLR